MVVNAGIKKGGHEETIFDACPPLITQIGDYEKAFG
jgi:hypothetical protein